MASPRNASIPKLKIETFLSHLATRVKFLPHTSAIEPWIWPRRSPDPETEDDLQTQVNCYEAFFQIFWKKVWVLGAYFWKWFPKARQGRVYGKGFSPQNKPAQQVMSKWYAENKN